jgi:pimeloyl-ACP methyl ester carboxylesterase
MKLSSFLFLIFICFGCQDRPDGLDKRLKTYRYPYKTKLYKFLSQGKKLEMAYMIKGQSENTTDKNKKYFLLIHGKNFSGAYFEDLANFLIAKGYTVIIPDLIGFGRSSKPVNYQYSFHELARSLHGLIKWYSIDNLNVLGHSMGGMVATRFALMYPKMVNHLVLLNPIGLEDYKIKVPYISIDKNFENNLKLKPENVKAYQEKNYYDGNWKEKYQQWLQLQTGWIKGPDWRELAYISALTYDMIYTQPVFYEFKNLKVKTSLIIGDRDKTALGKNLVEDSVKEQLGNYKKIALEVSMKIPKAKLYFLNGIGHLPHIENVKALKDIMNTIF